VPIPEPPKFFLDWDEEEEMFLKKHYGHLLQEIRSIYSTHAEPQAEISDLIRDLKTLKNTAELLPSRLNSVIF